MGHKRNFRRKLDLWIHRKRLPPTVPLYLDYVDPAATRAVYRALTGRFAGHSMTPIYRHRRMVFALPARTRVAAPILRNPGEYQPVALVATGLNTLRPGRYLVEVVQRVPGGPIQGLLRFQLIRK